MSIYFDSLNNWLFVDWEGELTLAKVQLACLEVARCYLSYAYPRVLNSNAQVLSVTPDVSDWLVHTFMPALDVVGVKQLAWVFPPTLRSRSSVLDTFVRFPHLAISLFDDVEAAVSWLQQTVPEPLGGGGALKRLPADQAQMQALLHTMTQQLAGQLRESLVPAVGPA